MAGDSSEERRRHPAAIRRHDADQHAADEPEEGAVVVVPGYQSDTDTEEYYNRHSDSDETVSDDGSHAAACSVVPAQASCYYYGDDATSRYSVAARYHGSAAAAASSYGNGGCEASSSKAAAMPMLACPVCGKEFRSQKAVCGHMKVHQRVAAIGIGSSQDREQGIVVGKGKGIIKRGVDAVVGRWGGTGKRGCSGFGVRAAAGTTPSAAAESEQPMGAIVVAEPQIVFQPMPLAFAAPNLSSSSVTIASASPIQPSVPMAASAIATPVSSMASASPNPSSLPVASAIMTNVSGHSSSAEPIHNVDAMGTSAVAEAAAAANPLSEAAPPAAGEQGPPADHHQQPPPMAAARPRQNPMGYTCDECTVWFPTHQGLGGHVAGHRNREAAAGFPAGDGAAAAAACRRGARQEKEHVCKVCGAVFLAGVQLGGHMRKHYGGPPIVPNKRPRLVASGGNIQTLLPPPQVALTLALSSVAAGEASSPAPAVEAAAAAQPAGPEPAVEGTTPEPAPGPAVAGRVLLFGIDIGAVAVQKQKPATKEGPPSATEGSESTGGGEQ
ncbi:unnamed protein product [Urochloa humidicola]